VMRLVLVTAVAGLVCGAVAAAAATRPGIAGNRIGAVTLGEPKARVTKALGGSTPVQIQGGSYRFYRNAGIYVLYGTKRGLPRRARTVLTRSARYQTSSAIGVGASLRQLRRTMDVRCHPTGRWIECVHGLSFQPSQRPKMLFQLSKANKRVNRIAITSPRY